MALGDQSPHQLTVHLLNKAGEVDALSFRPWVEGFMVKTTWRLRMTCCVNQRYSSSGVSSIWPSRCEPSLHCVINVVYSSPSNKPGTSPFSNSVFIRSRKSGPRTRPGWSKSFRRDNRNDVKRGEDLRRNHPLCIYCGPTENNLNMSILFGK